MPLAEVAELADAQVSGTCRGNSVRVQVPPSAPAFARSASYGSASHSSPAYGSASHASSAYGSASHASPAFARSASYGLASLSSPAVGTSHSRRSPSARLPPGRNLRLGEPSACHDHFRARRGGFPFGWPDRCVVEHVCGSAHNNPANLDDSGHNSAIAAARSPTAPSAHLFPTRFPTEFRDRNTAVVSEASIFTVFERARLLP